VSCFKTTPQGDADVSSGNLVLVTDVPTCAAQELNSKFKFFLGEWFADKRLGVPYFQFVLIRNPNMGIVRQVFTAVIDTVQEITGIVSADITYVSTNRTCSALFQLSTKDGVLLVGGPGVPFIISGIGASA
jgi:hypothetical protein